MHNPSSFKYKREVKKTSRMTCIMAGKCSDGAVLVSDSKITYIDHPPSYQDKLYSKFYPIVAGGAGSTDLCNEFQKYVVPVTQPNFIMPENFHLSGITTNTIKPVQTSGVINMYGGPYNFSTVSNNLGHLVKGLNRGKSAEYGFDIIAATQIGDKANTEVMLITRSGQSDIYEYGAIGSSGPYSYPFLKPLYVNASKPSMHEFARTGYFIIRLIEKLDLDERVGGDPQIWFIPNIDELYRGKDRPDLMESFEDYSNRAIEDFMKLILG
jgi:20S proteasome alpha/beta subunit